MLKRMLPRTVLSLRRLNNKSKCSMKDKNLYRKWRCCCRLVLLKRVFDCDAANVTALLFEYKNTNFNGFNAMDEFVLE